MDVRDIARALDVSVTHAYKLIAAGKVPATRIAGVLRVPHAAWRRFLIEQSELALANCHRVETRDAP